MVLLNFFDVNALRRSFAEGGRMGEIPASDFGSSLRSYLSFKLSQLMIPLVAVDVETATCDGGESDPANALTLTSSAGTIGPESEEIVGATTH